MTNHTPVSRVDVLYCDNCASALGPATCLATAHGLACTLRRHWVEELPLAVDSANAGESAILCAACFEAVRAGDASQLRALCGESA